MPNPYDDLFNNGDENQKDPQDRPLDLTDSELGEKDNFKTDGKEPLDEIVENIQRFDKEAEAFAKLLSRTKAIDHKVMTSVERILFMELKPKEELTLIEEREYHHLLRKKFEAIINPMRNLAKIHLEVVQQYNTDIDAEYFSTEKTDHTVNSEKSSVVNNINIQRKILADASDDLTILKDALEVAKKELVNILMRAETIIFPGQNMKLLFKKESL